MVIKMSAKVLQLRNHGLSHKSKCSSTKCVFKHFKKKARIRCNERPVKDDSGVKKQVRKNPYLQPT